jgi:hypothetical protein
MNRYINLPLAGLAAALAVAAGAGAVADDNRPEPEPNPRVRVERSVDVVQGPAGRDVRSTVQLSPEALGKLNQFYETSEDARTIIGLFGGGSPSPTVSLDVRDVPIRELVNDLTAQTKATFNVDGDVPDTRVTLKAKNVRLDTVLDLATQSADVGWRVESPAVPPGGERPSRSAVYRIGKTLPRRERGVVLNATGMGGGSGFLGPRFLDSVPYQYFNREERSTFTCPHCKATNTVSRVRQQPKCPKCTRVFQPDWQFCPADGAKRPAGPSDWKYCPSCGKQVTPPKAQEGNIDLGDPNVTGRRGF